VARREPPADGVAMSLLLPAITPTEFGGGVFRNGPTPQPGMVAHSAAYVGRVIPRALRTGEERIDIRRPGAAGLPGAARSVSGD
jgi:hypothetical protein